MTTNREVSKMANDYARGVLGIHYRKNSKAASEIVSTYKAGWMAGYGDLITQLESDKKHLEKQIAKK